MPLIEIEKIKKVYDEDGVETQALRGISFSIDTGEFVAIMGPSGSGKSTLLHILGFLDRQSHGTYAFNGKKFSIDDFAGDTIAKLRNQELGFVFQAFNLLPRLSVLENVKLPLAYSQMPESEWDQAALKAIEAVGISHRAHHAAVQLSGGEKQRAAIARALVNNPKIIFADEPTGNLDSKSGKTVIELLKSLNEHGGHTIVLITHDRTIAEYAKRILVLRDGELESDEKIHHPRS